MHTGVEGSRLSLTITRSGVATYAASATVDITAGNASFVTPAPPDSANPKRTIITWAVGEAGPKTFVVLFTDDTIKMGGQFNPVVTVSLSSVSGEVVIDDAAKLVSIRVFDDEHLPLIGFESATYQAEEINSVVNVVVQRTVDQTEPTSPVVVDVMVKSGTVDLDKSRIVFQPGDVASASLQQTIQATLHSSSASLSLTTNNTMVKLSQSTTALKVKEKSTSFTSSGGFYAIMVVVALVVIGGVIGLCCYLNSSSRKLGQMFPNNRY